MTAQILSVFPNYVRGGYVDLLLTDPPYGVDYTGSTKEKLKIKNDALDDDSLKEMLASAFSAADSVMKPGAVFYIWHADSKALARWSAGKFVKFSFGRKTPLLWADKITNGNMNRVCMGGSLALVICGRPTESRQRSLNSISRSQTRSIQQ